MKSVGEELSHLHDCVHLEQVDEYEPTDSPDEELDQSKSQGLHDTYLRLVEGAKQRKSELFMVVVRVCSRLLSKF